MKIEQWDIETGNLVEKNKTQNEQETERTTEMKEMCIQSVLPGTAV